MKRTLGEFFWISGVCLIAGALTGALFGLITFGIKRELMFAVSMAEMWTVMGGMYGLLYGAGKILGRKRLETIFTLLVCTGLIVIVAYYVGSLLAYNIPCLGDEARVRFWLASVIGGGWMLESMNADTKNKANYLIILGLESEVARLKSVRCEDEERAGEEAKTDECGQ